LEFLARIIKQEEEIKGRQIRMEEVKLSVLADDMKVYLKISQNSIRKFPDNISTFIKLAGYKNKYANISKYSMCQQ
jgi:hypothetical protein